MSTTDRASATPPFGGIPAGAKAVPVPAILFTSVFPSIEDVAELVVTLYATAAVQRLRRFPRLLEAAALRADRALVETLASLLPHDDVDQAFQRGLDAAVARGTLLRLQPSQSGADDPARGPLLTLNSAADRRAVERVQRGQLAAATGWIIEPAQPRAAQNVYAIYEQTIGPISPQIADELSEAEGLYPAEWIEEAFRESAELNKRSWRYVKRILERWQQEGRDDETSGRHSRWRPDSRYEHLIRH